MIQHINPWISTWTRPRLTVRSIVNIDPNFFVLLPTCLYVLEAILTLVKYWSLGLFFSNSAILSAAFLLTPFVAWIWLYFTALLLSITGKWVGGGAPLSHLRAALAWSKIPISVSLFLWLQPLLSSQKTAFILIQSGLFSLFTSLVSIALSIWSFILLIQAIREVQGISTLRSLLNVVSAWLISSVILVLIFCLSSTLAA